MQIDVMVYCLTWYTTVTNIPMRGFWYFVPKSGVAFIFVSVLDITIWNGYKNTLEHPYVWIITTELCLFFICFVIADRERPKRIMPK